MAPQINATSLFFKCLNSSEYLSLQSGHSHKWMGERLNWDKLQSTQFGNINQNIHFRHSATQGFYNRCILFIIF